MKELGVGIESVTEKSNGTVIVKCKNANDRDKLQKKCVEKIGVQYNVQVTKDRKKFVKIMGMDIEEDITADQDIIDNIIQQNNW